VNGRAIAGKRLLLLDDLIRSGATLGAVAAALTDAGAAIIFAFAMTKTRRVKEGLPLRLPTTLPTAIRRAAATRQDDSSRADDPRW
jgi:adenine/guanine phosphoribosyltransferase-like PRPP-binding protein